jgi:hypothetical protein
MGFSVYLWGLLIKSGGEKRCPKNSEICGFSGISGWRRMRDYSVKLSKIEQNWGKLSILRPFA